MDEAGFVSRSALDTIADFLRDANVQGRKNAATALAILADPDALKLLTDLALNDPEPDVRLRCEMELLQLDGTILETARHHLLNALDQPPLAPKAYGLLGRLRGDGWRPAPSRASWWQRLRLAWGRRRELATERTLGSRLLLVTKLAAIGGVLATFVLSLFFWIARTGVDMGQDLTALMILGPLLGLTLSAFSLSRSSAVLFHWHRGAIVTIELAGMLLCGTVAGVLLATLGGDSGFTRAGVVFGLAFGVAAAAARAAVMLAGIGYATSRGGRSVAATVGFIAGAVGLTAAFAKAPAGVANEVAEFWPFLLVAIAGIATAAAAIETSAASESARERGGTLIPAPSARKWVIGLAAVLMLLLVVVVWRGRVAREADGIKGEPVTGAPVEQRKSVVRPLETLPVEIGVTLPTAQVVKIMLRRTDGREDLAWMLVPAKDLDSARLATGEDSRALRLSPGPSPPSQPLGPVLRKDDPDPPTAAGHVKAGSYVLLCGSSSAVTMFPTAGHWTSPRKTSSAAFGELMRIVSGRRAGPASARYELELEFDATAGATGP
jgi:hypothetical protein